MGKINLTRSKGGSLFRKVAMGTWTTAKDPSTYGIMEIDMRPALKLMKEIEEEEGVKITPGHLVARALAKCLDQRPEINGMIRGNKIYLRDNVSLFFQVNVPGKGKDNVKKATLSGACLHNVEKMSVMEISKSLSEKVKRVREVGDDEVTKNMNIVKFIPWRLMGLYLDFASWLIYGLNINLSFLGLPKDPFGSAMITNVGPLGADVALAPLCPYTKVPLLLCVGAVKEKAIVENGNVIAAPVLPIGVTFDHRFIDGAHGAFMLKLFKDYFKSPHK